MTSFKETPSSFVTNMAAATVTAAAAVAVAAAATACLVYFGVSVARSLFTLSMMTKFTFLSTCYFKANFLSLGL